ncbi:hypothetical protein Pst134EA_030503 [Puccinia striiformis f. sp. tritici]|uniref:hypothetical protein n=1 Tax=Puccinia striiformis f. sp. tritici TaxID=168172 RepID=UPI002007A8AF|nr:hypothetical protein Pst134EA_030503 [Puccinia striiformis f. sp. tritici]KAH9446592.1 hypothetical protein Pst134EA_030503 [Puccinia striiformis f. sp. tritici]KAI9600555.1 hypothetical protein H4Q26_000341 [Puccinia striiformis f. sp. tritici PST-130]
MIHDITAILILALFISPGGKFCAPASIDDVVNEGRETARSVKDMSVSPEIHPTTAQGQAHNIQNAGKPHGQETIHLEALPGRLEHESLATVARENHILNGENGPGRYDDQDHFAAKKADWDSMIQSHAELEESFKSDIGPGTTQNDLNIMKSVSEGLTVCHNHLWYIYGPPTMPPRQSWFEKSASQGSNSISMATSAQTTEEEYRKSIWNLVPLLYEDSGLSVHLYHLRLSWNSCILQTINYLRRYKLMPVDMEQDLGNLLKRPDSLKWIAVETQDTFKYDRVHWNNFHSALSQVEFLENHPQLSQHSEIYKGLGKKEQDFVLFYRSKLMISDFYSGKYYKVPYDPTKLPTRTLHMNFLSKMEKILLRELEEDNTQPDRLDDILEVREELLEIRDFFIKPSPVPNMEDKPLSHVMRFSFLLQEIVQRKFGSDHLERLGLVEHEDIRLEFQRNFEFLKAVGQMELWRTLMLDYGWFLLINTKRHREVPRVVWQRRGSFLWGKLLGSAEVFQTLINREQGSDPAWDGIRHGYRYFYYTKVAWDKETRRFDMYHNKFLSSANWQRGDEATSLERFFLSG